MNKTILSGIVVVVLFTLFPVLLPLISPIFGELDYSWLADGNITLGEIIAFVGALLIALSQQTRQAFRQLFVSEK